MRERGGKMRGTGRDIIRKEWKKEEVLFEVVSEGRGERGGREERKQEAAYSFNGHKQLDL